MGATLGFVGMRDAAKRYDAFGTETLLRATSGDTAGAMDVIESTFPAGAGVPRHFHTGSDQAILVVDGEMTICVDDRSVEATAGTFIYVPKGAPHSFMNVSGAACRIFAFFVPMAGPGMEHILEGANAQPKDLDPAQLVAAMRQVDIHPVG